MDERPNGFSFLNYISCQIWSLEKLKTKNAENETKGIWEIHIALTTYLKKEFYEVYSIRYLLIVMKQVFILN